MSLINLKLAKDILIEAGFKLNLEGGQLSASDSIASELTFDAETGFLFYPHNLNAAVGVGLSSKDCSRILLKSANRSYKQSIEVHFEDLEKFRRCITKFCDSENLEVENFNKVSVR